MYIRALCIYARKVERGDIACRKPHERELHNPPHRACNSTLSRPLDKSTLLKEEGLGHKFTHFIFTE